MSQLKSTLSHLEPRFGSNVSAKIKILLQGKGAGACKSQTAYFCCAAPGPGRSAWKMKTHVKVVFLDFSFARHARGCAEKVSESVCNCATVSRFCFLLRCSRGRAQRVKKVAGGFCVCLRGSNLDLDRMSQLKPTISQLEPSFELDAPAKIKIITLGTSIWIECRS